MIAAIGAAIFARSAAIEIRRAADAADETLSHAKSMGSIELRPYLFVDHITYVAADLLEGRANNKAIITIRNFGSTPAKGLEIRAGCGIADTAINGLGVLPNSEQRVGYFLAPGATVDIAMRIDNFRERKFPSDRHLLACRFALKYQDSFGGDYGLFETWYLPRDEMNGSKLFCYHGSP